MKRTMKAIAADIVANVNAIHESRVTWDEFSSRNHALWREADLGRMCIHGSRAERRVAQAARP